jgi:hypothetical protein
MNLVQDFSNLVQDTRKPLFSRIFAKSMKAMKKYGEVLESYQELTKKSA